MLHHCAMRLFLGRCFPVPGARRRPLSTRPLESLESRVVLSHVTHHPATAVAAAVTSTPTLSPPWYSFRNELNDTVGKTPGVVVSPLVQDSDNQYEVEVSTKSNGRGLALASVLSLTVNFGGVTVQVHVVKPNGMSYTPVTPATAHQLGALEEAALSGNKMFKEVVVQQSSPFGAAEDVYPVFTKSVVQYYNDNIADLYNNQNSVAADAFRDVLAPMPGGFIVNPSTAK